ncbi:MAG: RodZ domain-containing protein [Pseudomonadota bacterium]
MELRGFDSYDVTLGDFLRGERACRGWSLRDASRELCIRPELIEAIEDADLDVFPNRSVVPGYVRSYARALHLDADDIYNRFCDESGFQSSLQTYGMRGAAPGDIRVPGPKQAAAAPQLSGHVGADLSASRFAVRPAPRRIGATLTLGAITSGLTLMGLIAAVGYGGYAVLQDFQRVGFVPLPEAPAVVADAPEIAAGPSNVPASAVGRPSADAYDAEGVLLGVAQRRTVGLPRRDGPIAALDPAASGLVRPVALREQPVLMSELSPAGAAAVGEALALAAPADVLSDGVDRLTADPLALTMADPSVDPDAVTIVASDRSWVRVRDGNGAVLLERILEAGERYDLPSGMRGATLRAGNAAGMSIQLGATRYGPLGGSGRVVKDVSLDPEFVRETYLPQQAAVLQGAGSVAAAE